MNKVLITGGLGFIGYHLSRRLLAEDYEVHAVDNGARGIVDAEIKALRSNKRYRLLFGDLMDSRFLDVLDLDYTDIYHLAAIVGVQNVIKRPYAVLDYNVSLLSRVLSLAKEQRSLHRFVFTSTSEVYSGTLRYFGLTIPTPESTPLAVCDLREPRTSYMLSKIYGEALCNYSGRPFTIVRLHNVYGPRMGMAHVIPELLMRAHHNPPSSRVPVYSAEHSRTFCYVDDAIELIVRLTAAPEGCNETFNVGSMDQETTISSLSKIIFEIVGKNLTMQPAGTTEGSPLRRRPDITRAISVTGYTPFVSLRDGIRRTYDWYRSRIFETV